MLTANALRDLRLALRSLLRTPAFTVVAVLTLAIGIGATTAIYTVIQRVILDPLPYPEADRLVRLKNQVPGEASDAQWNMSAAQYFYLGAQARSIEAIGAYNVGGMNLHTPEGPLRGRAAQVSFSTMRMIGAQTALGRGITESDDVPGATPVVVLSHGFWQREFGGNPDALGGTIEVGGKPVEIVGVLEPGTDLPQGPGGEPTDVWIPLASVDSRFNPDGPFHPNHTTPMFARLAPGVTPAQAQAELDQLTARLPEAFPGAYSQRFFDQFGFRTTLYPMKQYIVGDAAESLWILFGAVGLVLLIACANVANLLLVRLEGRRRELAIRSALGAGRVAMARQFLAEGFVLSMAGGVLALLLSVWGVEALVALAPANFPRLENLQVDVAVMLFGLGLSLITTLAIAVFPILRASDSAPGAGLADGGRGATSGRERQRVRSILVVTQVALALVLIVGAGLLVESFQRLRAVDPGVNADGVLTVQLDLSGGRYQDIPAMWRFHDAVLDQVRALPGVTAAGMSQTVPLTGGFGCTVQGFEDSRVYGRLSAADLTTCAGQQPTTPGYFEAMGIPLLRGRAFTDLDNEQPNTGAVIVSKAFAERFWPGEDPIGKGVGPEGRTNQQFYRVVGVVGDVYNSSPAEEPAIVIYYPTVRIPETVGWTPSMMTLAIRTTLDRPLSLLPPVRAAVVQVDPAVPLANAQEMQTMLSRSMSRVSFAMTMIGLAAGMALLLAAIGLYGVIAYVVARRTGEIGIRMALGAQTRQVQRLVVASSFKLVGLGLVAGGGGAVLLTQVMRGLLYGVQPTDPSAYVAGAVLLMAVALLASYLPARRAARVDPVVALRGD